MKSRTVRAWGGSLLVAASLLAGCSSAPELDGSAAAPSSAEPTLSTSPSSPEPTVVPEPTPTPEPVVDAAAVVGAVEAAGAQAGGTIQVALVAPEGSVLVASPSASTPIYTASLVKMFVVEQLLARRAAGTVTLSEGDLALMQRAVVVSDDNAMSALWVKFGGADLVSAAAVDFGLSATAPPRRAGQWGETTTSAADYARFLSLFPSRLGPEDNGLLLSWMRSAAPVGADGFNQAFGFLSPGVVEGEGVKQGWMCCLSARRQLHSGAVLPDGRTAVLLGDFPSSVSWDAARSALNVAASAVVAA